MRSTPLQLRCAAATVVLLALAGCGQVEVGDPGRREGAAARPAGSIATANSASSSPAPSLPPGDPGVDAPSVPDPGTSGLHDDHGDAGRRRVPPSALLGADDVASLTGGEWTESAGRQDECAQPPQWRGRRTVVLASSSARAVVTVSTHDGERGADAAVDAVRLAIPDCGWELGRDPRLGSTSVAATRGRERLAVAAAEGVTVVVTGRDLAGWAWTGLVDMALGTSCWAATHGCH